MCLLKVIYCIRYILFLHRVEQSINDQVSSAVYDSRQQDAASPAYRGTEGFYHEIENADNTQPYHEIEDADNTQPYHERTENGVELLATGEETRQSEYLQATTGRGDNTHVLLPSHNDSASWWVCCGINADNNNVLF